VAIRSFAKRFLSLASFVATAVVLAVCMGTPATQRHPIGSSGSSFIRGIYGTGPTSLTTTAGFNTVNVSTPTKAKLDAVQAAGYKAVIWLGNYDRTISCQFQYDDTWIRNTVTAIAGHPAIAAYQLSDEPNYARTKCPNTVQQHRERAALIKSIDPSKPTYVTISTWDGHEMFPYQYFVGVADILGLDVYPCTYTKGCGFSLIDGAVKAAAADGVTKFWAIVQDFHDDYYRDVTALELKTEFQHWAGSGMSGYFVYHWVYGSIATKPDHISVLADVAALYGGSSPAPDPTTSPTASPSPSPTPSPTVTSTPADPPATSSPSPEPSVTSSPTPSKFDCAPGQQKKTG
jgi:hypothetical protein